MWRKVLIVAATIFFAFGILFVSVFRTASVKYEFNPLNPKEKNTVLGERASQIDYYLPYPGRVLPDNPIWPLKASRDSLWLLVNTRPTREAELKLLFADKRLGSAAILFEKGKTEIGFSTLTKAEKYLEEAHKLEIENRASGLDTSEFLVKLAQSSLKHFEVIEYILEIAPEDAKPSLTQLEEYPKKTYRDVRNTLLDQGKVSPKNPFSWE
jgi:hypothetical protein